ncbi:MAG TPA: hypothetical protein VFV98_00940 [Vicinamibacterales bacterium]|nr:hypothetical protein [Vicinamibacterales bacterium]
MTTRRLARAVGTLVLALASMAQSRTNDALAEARRMYNAQKFDAAIAAAIEARKQAGLADAAAVVLARARLERFQQTADRTELGAARDVLKLVDATRLSRRDHTEFLIALGESLYLDDDYELDDRYSAAAELFEIALDRADEFDQKGRDQLFAWWAVSLDRHAQRSPDTERRANYDRILARAQKELGRADAAISASYWLAAAARGARDLPRAWSAAVAGWIRAGSLGARGAALRADLDNLIVQVILPERARELLPGADPQPAMALLQEQWNGVKDRWK